MRRIVSPAGCRAHSAARLYRLGDRLGADRRAVAGTNGRFLDLTERRYDLITSEPPPPLQDGVYRLYSTEYYEAALEHLTPGGMVTQWLPVSQLSNTTVSLMISTFRSVLPQTLLFSGYGAQLILVGSRQQIDLARLERRAAEDPTIATDLARLRIRAPRWLLAIRHRVRERGQALRLCLVRSSSHHRIQASAHLAHSARQ